MTDARHASRFDVVPGVVGILLLVLAGIIAWDAASLTLATPYGLGPQAVPNLIAGGLALLGCGHLVAAVRGGIDVEGFLQSPDSRPACVADGSV